MGARFGKRERVAFGDTPYTVRHHILNDRDIFGFLRVWEQVFVRIIWQRTFWGRECVGFW